MTAFDPFRPSRQYLGTVGDTAEIGEDLGVTYRIR